MNCEFWDFAKVPEDCKYRQSEILMGILDICTICTGIRYVDV